MIIAATFMFHDYEPRIIYLDSSKLDPDYYIDSCVLKKLKTKKEEVHIEAHNWEDDPKFKGVEPNGPSEAAYTKVTPKKIDRAVILKISFE